MTRSMTPQGRGPRAGVLEGREPGRDLPCRQPSGCCVRTTGREGAKQKQQDQLKAVRVTEA